MLGQAGSGSAVSASPDFGFFAQPFLTGSCLRLREEAVPSRFGMGLMDFGGLGQAPSSPACLWGSTTVPLPHLSPSLCLSFSLGPLVQVSGGARGLEVPPLRTELMSVP